MSDSRQQGAAGGTSESDDPEILELLTFTPVPRQFKRKDGWTPALQRRFIALLAKSGSPTAACEALGKNRHGVEKLYKAAGAASFRAAWDAAVEIAERRAAERIEAEHKAAAGLTPPFVDHRRKAQPFEGPLPGQVMNERGEWEDEESLRQRVDTARDSISDKLLRCRRMYLAEISSSAGKRAAFEILTRYPIDWDRAARMEPQDDEPWKKPRMRNPDMLLTAENGWMGGMAHGEDKMAELRAELDKYREEMGLEPVDWSEEKCGEGPTSSSPTPIGEPPSDPPPAATPKDKPPPRLRRI